MTLYYFLTHKNLTKPLPIIAQCSAGFICSIFIFGLVYQQLGLLDIFPFNYASWNTILKNLGSGHHNANLLFNVYLTDYRKVIKYSLCVFLGLHILSLLSDRLHHRFSRLSIIALPMLFICFVAVYNHATDSTAYNIIFSTVDMYHIHYHVHTS